jgi:hypothetical protein
MMPQARCSMAIKVSGSFSQRTSIRIRSIDDVIDDVGELGVNDEWSGGGSQTPGQQRLEVVG